jgi:hypothetical protein
MALAVALSTLTLGAGCHRYVRGPELGYRDGVVGREAHERPSARIEGGVVQNGREVTVHLRSRCEVVDTLTIERTHLYDRVSTAGARRWVIPALGAAAMGAGIYLLATAGDRPTATDPMATDPTLTRSGALGFGASLTALGFGGVAWAAGHAIRTARPDREVEGRFEEGPIREADVACTTPRPAPPVPVVLASTGRRLTLGTTGPSGELRVDLIEVVPRSWIVGAHAPARAELSAGDAPFGTVDLRPVAEHHERRAWSASAAMRCASPRRVEDCREVADYARDFPWGAHADEARSTLASAQEALAAITAREESERRAEAERQRAEAERLRAEEEARRAEAERLRLEAERERRLEAERWERERAREEREARARLEEARHRREQAEAREEARRECRAACRRGCGSSDACLGACVREQCD